MSVRVRYAPSPTGHLHIGNARTALFNYLFARKHQGKFIIRIEDTDVARNIETGIESQLKQLRWLGIDWDESIDKEGTCGPYRQLERLPIYQKYADELVDKGVAYRCYCTPEELSLEREKQIAQGDDKLHYSRTCLNKPFQEKPHTLRFKIPENQEYFFDDMVKGTVSFSSADIGDWVIVKQNGIPTYNFACAIDDYLMKISHVLRGEDHLTNTPKQQMVFEAFDWDKPRYGHMTLIVNEQGKKLSKRDESIIQFIEQYNRLGYLPEALFNFIALLGWSPDKEGEIFSKEEIIEYFDASRLSVSPARFDTDKLTYINNRYIKQHTANEILELCKPFLKEEGIGNDKNDDWFMSLIEIFKDRLSYGKEIVHLYHEFLSQPFDLNDECLAILKEDGARNLLETFNTMLIDSSELQPSDYKDLIKQAGSKTGSKGKALFMPIRVAVSASMHGPDLPQMMHLLGKKLLLERLVLSINAIRIDS